MHRNNIWWFHCWLWTCKYCLVNHQLLILHHTILQNQPSRGVLRKRYLENMQQIYWRTSMSKCYFNQVPQQLYWNHASAWVLCCTGKLLASSIGLFCSSFFLISILKENLLKQFFYIHIRKMCLSKKFLYQTNTLLFLYPAWDSFSTVL